MQDPAQQPVPDALYQGYDKNLYRITGEEEEDDILNMLSASPGGDPTSTGSGSLTVSADSVDSGVSTSTTTQASGGASQQGKSSYDNTVPGYILGFDASTGLAKFYIGNSTNYLNWTGTALVISGSITATAGNIGGWIINSTNLTSASGNVILDSGGVLTIGTGNNVVILSSTDATYRLWVGNATAASAPFSITKAGAIAATSGTIGGWTIGATTLSATGLLLDAGNQAVGTSTFVSGQTGWNISATTGVAEFNNVVARGEFRTAVFVSDAVHATGGTMLVLNSSVLQNNFTSVTGPSTSNLDLKDPPSGHTQLFAVNDILRLKDGSGNDNWVKVSSVSNQTTFYRYVVVKQSGTNATFYAGTAVVDYGTSTSGFVLLTSDLSNSPYIDVGTAGTTPWAGTTSLTRLGNLAGITDPVFGALTGYGIWTSNGYFSGSIFATAGYFGNATNGIQVNSSGLQIIGTGYLETDGGTNERVVIQHSGTFGNQITFYDGSNNQTMVMWGNGSNSIQIFSHGGQPLQMTQFSSASQPQVYLSDQVSSQAGFYWTGPTGGGTNSATRTNVGAFHFNNVGVNHGNGVYLTNGTSGWDGSYIVIQPSTDKVVDVLQIRTSGWSSQQVARITNEGYLQFPAYRHRSEFDETPGTALASTLVAKAYWTGGGTSGTQTVRNGAGGTFSADVWTYVELDTTSTASRSSTMTFNASLGVLNQTLLVMMVKNSNSTNTKQEWGWKYDATHYALFRFDTDVSSTKIYFVYNTGGSETAVDTGATIETGSFHIWKLWIYPGGVVFAYRDEAILATGSPSVPSQMSPWLYIDNKAVAQSNKMQVDFVELFTGRQMTP